MTVKKGGSGRQRKIESEMQRVLAELIAREVKDPRVGNVTVTGCAARRRTWAWRRCFTRRSPRRIPQKEVQSGLTRAAGFLRGEVGRRLGLRHAPRLGFRIR